MTVDEYVAATVAKAPSLSAQQQARLAKLLNAKPSGGQR